MDKELIFIGSVTQAMRARDILKKYGINAVVERETDRIGSTGCGFGILVVGGSREQAVEILQKHGMRIGSEKPNDS